MEVDKAAEGGVTQAEGATPEVPKQVGTRAMIKHNHSAANRSLLPASDSGPE